jgi:ABC-2 type transport system ATP-binding protein
VKESGKYLYRLEPQGEYAVRVSDVTMTFNIASEQFTHLKEYFLALVKRELFFKAFNALEGISFDIRQGDVFGLVGTNGSGKSTMLKIIAGVLDPTLGTCEVNGSIAPLIELGAGFDMQLSARENIYLNGALLGYSRDFIKSHFDEIIDFAELWDFLDLPLKNYSSGMVARIAFAIATVVIPDILIVDETLSVGDMFFQEKCEARIKSLIEEHNTTVLFVSHAVAQVERLCNRAIWIERGVTQMLGDAGEICEAYRHSHGD